MATDFGDESGEKLFDWMLRVGQEAGQEALAKSAKGLARPSGARAPASRRAKDREAPPRRPPNGRSSACASSKTFPNTKPWPT